MQKQPLRSESAAQAKHGRSEDNASPGIIVYSTEIAPCLDLEPKVLTMNARRTTVLCGLMLCIFAVLAWSAAQTKNATVDEPGHALSGWLMWHYSDFRLAPENPSLWQL